MGLVDKFKSLFKSDKLDVESRFVLSPQSISGTMSSFFMARDRQSGEVVGLKLCDPEKLEQFESRFKGMNKPTEGEIAVKMKHPHIVDTREHGVTTKGLRYLMMEYLAGPGLHALIHARDTILEGKRAQLVRQMADALDYVHRAEFIHRDVCPRNFICTADASSLKLIDFGLTVPAKPDFMKPGNRTGTPVYHAPEISRRRQTDQRVDIFALGVTAYQVCTCELPWLVTDKPAVSALAYDTTPPHDILEYRPTLNRTLASAIMQCLRPNPADRPQTLSEFLRLIFSVKRDDE
jgi:serine/threonine-protein kinase